MKNKLVIFFKDLKIKDVPLVGKNASLGEMYGSLRKKGVRIPDGFATTAFAYRQFMKESGLKERIKDILKDLDTTNVKQLMAKGAKIRKEILKADLSKEFKKEIVDAYKKLSKNYKVQNLDVAVRSSATAEDLPDASFAGQQETFLNIKGEAELLMAVKKCIASLFTNRAISYREDKGFDHFSIALSVGVQKMVRSDLASSGVMFTIDTESGFKGTVLINSIFGLGENIVQGIVTPDEFFVFKDTLSIISRNIAKKDIKMVYNPKGKKPVKNIKLKANEQKKASLNDKQVIELAKWGMIIEEHYKKPMDIEFAYDGKEKKMYITQARPETVQSNKEEKIVESFKLQKKGKILLTGQSVGNRIGSGKANKILSVKDISKFKEGEVLVTDMTDPDWEPIMKIASAIVTDKGGRTCHAAIVSRELGIPCVVGTGNATKVINSRKNITVNCAQGEEGVVYEGKLPYIVEKTNIKNFKKPKTKIMMNVGEPDLAFANSFLPNDGIGLARLEFLINNYIKIHPLALINYKKIKNVQEKKLIDELTKDYKDKKQYFVDKLAQGIAIIAASVYPKDVILRLSDFKSNEYANLIGGKEFEPIE